MSTDTVVVSVRGLEVFGRHGVFPAERELGQRFVIDIDITLAHARAAASDDLNDTVDYAALAAAVQDIVAGEPVALLEHLAGRIADRALAGPHARAVTVTVTKPHVAVPQTLTATAVTLTRACADDA